MSSPLGLTNFQGVVYTSDDGNTIDPNFSGSYNSIFNGSKFYYRPSVSLDEKSQTDQVGNSETQGNVRSVNARGGKKHQPDNSTDDLYDISTNSIIQYTNDEDLPALTLKPADFAYNRDFGVYPNNRLIVCRRFPSPVENDLTAVSMIPISTIVSWIPDSEENFFKFSTSEEWSTSNTSDPLNDLTDIFNSIFAKQSGINIKDEIKDTLGGVAKLLPIGGVAESLETTVTNYLLGKEGNPGTNFRYDNLPQGNPNFMGESAHREMNSIRSEISIPVKVVYEMKYINNVDPTIVFMDIVQNLLRFSSSQSVFYISQSGGKKINTFFNKFKEGDWIGALNIILNAIIYAVKELYSGISNSFKDGINAISDAMSGNTEQLSSSIENAFSKISNSALARYRIEFAKIIPASTGASSAPWHVTIGNPKNPFFSSGDMIVKGGEIKFNNTLGFNDLPTRIEFNFTIKSARNLGIQEIFDKFNVGAGRQYQRNSIKFQTDFYQGSVKNSGGGTTNPSSGAQA